jgi:Lrp/AsnC family leucine-responsive transcriptional regulator
LAEYHSEAPVDAIDVRILEALQADARTSRAALAGTVGLSPPAVHERIKRLEQSGLITGYHARLDPSRAGAELLVFVEVLIDPPAREASVLDALAECPEVQEVHHVTGEYSCLIKARVADRDGLKRLLLDKVNAQKGVRRTRTTLALATILESHRIVLGTEQGTEETR